MSPKLFPELRNRHGYTMMMFPNDHLPPHVHVYSGEKVARVHFQDDSPQVMNSNGFRQRELNSICAILAPYKDAIVTLWNEMHPDQLFTVLKLDATDEEADE